ncbi:helix-turn-helix domain-containing protein [Streptomyces zagrosensis]|uniref:Transcriptional regulator with XRE-family HTH domain n=1 Tax=Streptomyces zagrosensis TaxID=1042984 RepID=A0A7W9UZJ2_9ACTN|nr:helix-turn-helix transcriptional regulator [Streptomyces zagrosensis]MBB5935834.1 transcriptional regulator with XRE-family HTH domain [Streptomyces zagrosensis]
MDTPAELGNFLRTRRARLQPEDVGLVSYGGRRRVPGLRREELAQLAGVSVAYYTRLEQGQSGNASDGVLDAIARALRLTPDEHEHLRNLARPGRAARRPAPRAASARPGARQLIAAMDAVPALVLDLRYDVLAWNPLGHALLAGHVDAASPEHPAERPNTQRLLFLDPHARELYPDWEGEARRAVSSLRLAAGEHPQDRQLAELIGELTIKSAEFAALWSRHPVRGCTSGVKSFHHPLVGPLELSFEMLRLPDSGGQGLLALSAEQGTPSEAALRLLAGTVAAAPRATAPLDETRPAGAGTRPGGAWQAASGTSPGDAPGYEPTPDADTTSAERHQN